MTVGKIIPARIARGYWAGVGRRLLRDPVALAAAFVIVVIVFAAILAPWLGLADPYRGSMLRRLRPISDAVYRLGSDELGRDMLSRLVYGGRLSLLMGVLPVVFAFFGGCAIGILAGFTGGRVDTAMMRTVDVFYAFPSVLLAIALSGALGAGIFNAIVSLTIVFTPPIARVAESVTTQIRTRDYVEAARLSGAGPLAIIRVHVLGNVLGPIFVYATSLISVSMILASGLSFLVASPRLHALSCRSFRLIRARSCSMAKLSARTRSISSPIAAKFRWCSRTATPRSIRASRSRRPWRSGRVFMGSPGGPRSRAPTTSSRGSDSIRNALRPAIARIVRWPAPARQHRPRTCIAAAARDPR